MKNVLRLFNVLVAWSLCLGWSSNTFGGLIAFTDFASFAAATSGGQLTVVGFEGISNNTIIGNNSTFQGITFQNGPGFLGSSLIVTNGIINGNATAVPTTNGSMFLGNSSTPTGQLLAGSHAFSMSYSNVNAVGMRIMVNSLSAPAALAGDIVLTSTAGAVTASLPAAQASTLADGSLVYFMGLMNDSGALPNISFTTPNSLPNDFSFRIDEIHLVAVPEPNSMALLLVSGSAWGLIRARQRKNRQRTPN